jgi:DinB family protein
LKPEIKSALERVFTRLELQLIAVAEEMPDHKYSFRPSTGGSGDVRTFGEQMRHVAAVQWVVGAALLGEKSPVDVGNGDDGPMWMTSKADILKYVKESFAYICRAVSSINDDKALEIIPHPYDPERTKLTRLALAAGYACHGWEHYGQMVVYQRMNGIVPPPSRPQAG